MSIINELTADNSVAMAVAAALETAIGGDLILGVGRPKLTAPALDLMPPGPVRVVHCAVEHGAGGGSYLALTETLAARLEASSPDEQLLSALAPAFVTANESILNASGDPLEFSAPYEVALDELLAESAHSDREHVVYTLIDGNERIAAFVVAIGPEQASAAAPAEATAPAMTGNGTAPASAPGASNVSIHEFQQLHESAISLSDSRSLSLLHEVEMGVTAELGRRRMTVRDLLALTPGAVIELDRAAGSPVDVLVNGTLIARGEVVVIDEEFGIRISEIVAAGANPSASAAA